MPSSSSVRCRGVGFGAESPETWQEDQQNNHITMCSARACRSRTVVCLRSAASAICLARSDLSAESSRFLQSNIRPFGNDVARNGSGQ